jgi:hypothetical protein
MALTTWVTAHTTGAEPDDLPSSAGHSRNYRVRQLFVIVYIYIQLFQDSRAGLVFGAKDRSLQYASAPYTIQRGEVPFISPNLSLASSLKHS